MRDRDFVRLGIEAARIEFAGEISHLDRHPTIRPALLAVTEVKVALQRLRRDTY